MACIAERYPSSRAQQHSTSSGPLIIAMRRCPSRVRWRVAVRPPDQFVAPTNGTSSGSSVVGSKTTNGIPFAVSRARSASESWATDSTQFGRRETVSSQVGAAESCSPNSDTMTPTRCCRATCSTPRMISTAHMSLSSRNTSSTTLFRPAPVGLR